MLAQSGIVRDGLRRPEQREGSDELPAWARAHNATADWGFQPS